MLQSSSSSSSNKRKKQCTRRTRATPLTVARVPDDAWLQICLHLHASPSHVFRLMAASRRVWEALKRHPKWWAHFYHQVLLYQERVLSVSPYVKTLQRYQSYEDKRRVLKLVFVRVCEACGAKQGHTLLHPLMARLCTLCVQQRVVSNRVLLKRYGLHFSDFLLQYHDAGGVLIAHRQNFKKSLDHSTSLLWLTCDPLDFETRQYDRLTGFKHQLLFFSVKDLEGILGISLADEERRHARRLEAMRYLGDLCRALNARRAMQNAYITVQDILVNDRWNRIQSSLRQQQVDRGFAKTMVMGGPFMLSTPPFLGGAFQNVLRLRPGLTNDDLARLRAVVDGAALL